MVIGSLTLPCYFLLPTLNLYRAIDSKWLMFSWIDVRPSIKGQGRSPLHSTGRRYLWARCPKSEISLTGDIGSEFHLLCSLRLLWPSILNPYPCLSVTAFMESLIPILAYLSLHSWNQRLRFPLLFDLLHCVICLYQWRFCKVRKCWGGGERKAGVWKEGGRGCRGTTCEATETDLIHEFTTTNT